MLKNYRFMRGQNILDNTYKGRMNNYFNPFEYNLESEYRDRGNSDITSRKTTAHEERFKKNK